MLSPDAGFEKVKIDSKGRISIPAYLRRNFGLKTGSEIKICCDLRSNVFILVFEPGIVFGNGQNGVVDSIGVCGASGPGAKVGPLTKDGKSGLSASPGSGPQKTSKEV